MQGDVKMSKLASCGGCGAKVGAGMLSQILQGIPTVRDENLLVGYDTSDDAAVYKVSDDLAIVQTLDFFPPIVDDPFMFGQIAAANAISDVYAMGATPKIALNIMTVTPQMSKEMIHEVLRGGYEKAYEAGAVIAGGHTINDQEPKYGLSVTGFARPDEIRMNCTPLEGDVLLLTKPLGIGITTTANRAEMAPPELYQRAVRQMATLNKYACEIAQKYRVHSMTDVTGFALMGHATEMARSIGGEYDIVVCCGGDGTLNETVCGLMQMEGPRPPLGYLPAGTTMSSFWDADVVRSGDHYTATKKSWAGALAPGASSSSR